MKKHLIPLILLLASIGFGIAYNIIGSEVAADGTLVEPFFLIPLAYLTLFIALIWEGVNGIRFIVKKINNK